MILAEIEQAVKEIDERGPVDAETGEWLRTTVLELIEKVRAQDVEIDVLRKEIVDLEDELRLANESGERGW